MALTALLLDPGAGAPAVVVEGGRVVAVGGAAPPGARRLDCAGDGLAIGAGAVNAHTHLYSGLAPLGMPPPSPPPRDFLEILQKIWWRLDRALDAASLRAAARLYLAESLLHGTTTLVDHHESPAFIDGSLDVLADAAQELGVRLLVGYGATERNGGRDEARRGLAECARFARANRRPLVSAMVGLHASFTVSDDTVREAGALARELALPVHVHVAEDRADVEDAHRRGHPGPLERLLALGGVPAGSVLAHGVHLDERSVRLADAAGAWLVQNPRSNEGNRVGYPRALAASSRVALGTDGWPAEMAAEQAALARLAPQHGDATAAVAARPAAGWRLLSQLGGEAFGPPIAPGSAADLVVAAPGSPPRHVVVAGRVVVQGGALQTGDLSEIRAHAREQAARVWKRIPSC